MPAARASSLLDAFGLRERRYVHLIGGGGKTTLMFAAAHALAGEGRSVLTTTSTRILYPGPGESDCVVLGADALWLAGRLRHEFTAHRHVTAVAPDPEDARKVGGLPVAVLDALVDARVAEHVLVEADGAAGRSLKAHADHEPVVSPCADLVIAVIGVDCLGMPMDDEHVHRAALLRERQGHPPGSLVTAEDVAAIVLHRDGWLVRVERDCGVIAFVNKVTTPEARDNARGLAGALRALDAGHRLAGVIVGDVRTGLFEDAG
jgi:probable selenium-dependent hydroxylase accessory protein YqeC